MTTKPPIPREIIFEFHRVGAYVRVTAMDVATQIEIAMMGAASAPQAHLEMLARQKLLQQLHKEGIV